MQFKQLTMGLFRVNNYLLFDNESKDIVLIDAGGDFQETTKEIENIGGNLKYILHTHGHVDHIAGDFDIQKHYNIPIYLHQNDEEQVSYFQDYLKAVGMPKYNTPENITYFNNDTTFILGNKVIQVIHTPGHTQGGVSYYIDGMLFSGDSLFYECIGRTDLPGGNTEQLISTIKDNLLTLPEDTLVYPGHGISTTIKHEKGSNSFI